MFSNEKPAVSGKANKWTGRRLLPVLVLAILVLSISFITRVALLIKTGHGFEYNFRNLAGSFLLGILYDLAMSAYLIVPFVLHIWLTTDKIYTGKLKWIAAGIYVVIIATLLFTNLVPPDFNSDLKNVLTAYIILRFAIFFFLSFTSGGFRNKWRTGVLYFDFFLVTFLLVFNSVSEWFFWDEFSARYNFIAVDYMVYTTEVLGNIKESYPIPAIIITVLVATAGIFLLMRPVIKKSVYAPSTFLSRSVLALVLLCLCVADYFFVNEDWRHFSRNEYANELAGNGIFQFSYAFWHNELDFYKFYRTLPDKQAFNIVRNELLTPGSRFTSKDPYNIERQIIDSQPEQRLNVVLISVESYSASFMKAFGNTQNITPHLDSLAQHSLFFTNMYASGTRTVRGLEALSLSLPPSPGQSIVKRPGNENLFSLGSVFRQKGYITQYLYGGYSYFDNMKHFFASNNYTVIDRDSIGPEDTHYQNIWGVADEDLFTLADKTFDRNYALGKPFFAQIMTVSNHRPYTYPAGRIDISPDTHSREGAVKYTDYAINRFLQESSAKPWYNNTIFVIVADHCAGSAGSVQLPVTGYHIPLLIFMPGNQKPQVIDRLMAQIDIPPTILGLLHFSYKSRFFGQDIFNLPAGKEKAFISTYQGLGFIQNKQLVLQTPVKKVRQYLPDFSTGTAVETALNDTLVNKAIAWYQVAAWLLKNKQYQSGIKPKSGVGQ